MTDPRMCLDGRLRSYPKISTEKMAIGSKFIFYKEIYKITRTKPTIYCVRSDYSHQEEDFRIGLDHHEPFYGSGGKLLNGAQG